MASGQTGTNTVFGMAGELFSFKWLGDSDVQI